MSYDKPHYSKNTASAFLGDLVGLLLLLGGSLLSLCLLQEGLMVSSAIPLEMAVLVTVSATLIVDTTAVADDDDLTAGATCDHVSSGDGVGIIIVVRDNRAFCLDASFTSIVHVIPIDWQNL